MEKRGPYTKYLRGCIRDSEETRDTCGISLRIASNPNVGGMRRCLGPTVCGTSGRRRSSFRGDVSATSWPTWIPSKGYERLVSSYRAQRGRSLYCYVYRCDVSLLSGAAEKAASPSGAVRVKGGYPTGLLLPCASVWGGEPRPNIGVSMSLCILASSLRSFACHVSQERPHTCLQEFMHAFIHSSIACGRSRIEFR